MSSEDSYQEESLNETTSIDVELLSWTLVDPNVMDDGRDLTAEELLGEDFEREAANLGKYLSMSYGQEADVMQRVDSIIRTSKLFGHFSTNTHIF